MNWEKLVRITAVLFAMFVHQLIAQNTPTKDPRAVSLLNSSISAFGGSSALSAIQDFQSSGTITFAWDQSTQVPATVKNLGNQFRLDATLSSGTRSWAVGAGSGVLVDTDGTRTPYSAQTSYSLRTLTFPVLDLLAAIADPNASISYIGAVSSDAGPAIQVHVQEVYAPSIDPTGGMSAAQARDYFIDPNTFLLVEIRDNQSSGGSSQLYTHSVIFAGFTKLNGIEVPLLITEMVAGQKTWVLQLSSVTFNVGLTNTDFQL